MNSKAIIALAFIINFSIHATSNDISDVFFGDATEFKDHVLHWDHVPIIQAQVKTEALDPSKTLITCEDVLRSTGEASRLLKKITQEQDQLALLFRGLEHASLEQMKQILVQVTTVTDRLNILYSELSIVMAPEFQIKDRIQTLSWTINSQMLMPRWLFPQLRKVEWGRLEVVSGFGSTYGAFHSQSSSERPVRKRVDDLLKMFPHDRDFQTAVLDQFDIFLRGASFWIYKNQPESRNLLSWQGFGQIIAVDVMTPAEACIPYLSLAGILAVDYAPSENPMIGPSTPASNADRYQMGVGSVFLTYHHSKNY